MKKLTILLIIILTVTPLMCENVLKVYESQIRAGLYILFIGVILYLLNKLYTLSRYIRLYFDELDDLIKEKRMTKHELSKLKRKYSLVLGVRK